MNDQQPTTARVPVDKLVHLVTKARKKLSLGHTPVELDPELNGEELLFHAPPLTEQLVEAIGRISPQFHLRPDERSRRFWELNQNGASWGEYRALQPFLDRLPPPQKVLDIGPGLGRSAVFFSRLQGWESTRFDLYEGEGKSTRYTQAGPRFEDSFCGDFDSLASLLNHNQVKHARIHVAGDLDYKLDALPGPYDFIYSFYAIGFHWSIEHFLDELLDQMHERSLGAFTLHERFEDLSSVQHLPHTIVQARQSWPRGRRCRLLVLAKSPDVLGQRSAGTASPSHA